MKKLLITASVALVTLGFVSCTKEYTCTCTLNGSSFTHNFKEKKAQAKKACDLWGQTYTAAGGSCTYN